MTGTVVFLGPSLPRAVAVAALPDGQFEVPARRGDLPRVVKEGAQHVALIDGEFRQSLATSVLEIRAALESGVEVWGASSMGAIRAAECGSIGMRGVGWIFERFRDGSIEADDEVALTFDPFNGQALTVPLVNLRWMAQKAVALGLCQETRAQQFLAVARQIPFDLRSWRLIIQAISDGGVRDLAMQLEHQVKTAPDAWDRKGMDARLLLETLHRELRHVC